MRHLSAGDYVTQPWKNGGGLTREIARAPETGEFDWRLSMATVAEDGAFSTFPGVDRTLTVLTGAGIVLTVAGREARLTPGVPFAFPGDVPAASRLLAGEVTDLNVMTRRGRVSHEVTRQTGPAMVLNPAVVPNPTVVLNPALVPGLRAGTGQPASTARGAGDLPVSDSGGLPGARHMLLFALTAFTVNGIDVARFDTLIPDRDETLHLPEGAEVLLIRLETLP
ncbi:MULTISPECIES: HutD family protein [unclassified Haematobacter]|uniref:HutD/Ves family protein n=1 Tax=unclassified Haematobacter TaxID=2640585 RepID=UPI0025C624C3|nr:MULTISPECIES: HutD family protein [unclassified Haematobacter]